MDVEIVCGPNRSCVLLYPPRLCSFPSERIDKLHGVHCNIDGKSVAITYTPSILGGAFLPTKAQVEMHFQTELKPGRKRSKASAPTTLTFTMSSRIDAERMTSMLVWLTYADPSKVRSRKRGIWEHLCSSEHLRIPTAAGETRNTDSKSGHLSMDEVSPVLALVFCTVNAIEKLLRKESKKCLDGTMWGNALMHVCTQHQLHRRGEIDPKSKSNMASSSDILQIFLHAIVPKTPETPRNSAFRDLLCRILRHFESILVLIVASDDVKASLWVLKLIWVLRSRPLSPLTSQRLGKRRPGLELLWGRYADDIQMPLEWYIGIMASQDHVDIRTCHLLFELITNRLDTSRCVHDYKGMKDNAEIKHPQLFQAFFGTVSLCSTPENPDMEAGRTDLRFQAQNDTAKKLFFLIENRPEQISAFRRIPGWQNYLFPFLMRRSGDTLQLSAEATEAADAKSTGKKTERVKEKEKKDENTLVRMIVVILKMSAQRDLQDKPPKFRKVSTKLWSIDAQSTEIWRTLRLLMQFHEWNSTVRAFACNVLMYTAASLADSQSAELQKGISNTPRRELDRNQCQRALALFAITTDLVLSHPAVDLKRVSGLTVDEKGQAIDIGLLDAVCKYKVPELSGLLSMRAKDSVIKAARDTKEVLKGIRTELKRLSRDHHTASKRLDAIRFNWYSCPGRRLFAESKLETDKGVLQSPVECVERKQVSTETATKGKCATLQPPNPISTTDPKTNTKRLIRHFRGHTILLDHLQRQRQTEKRLLKKHGSLKFQGQLEKKGQINTAYQTRDAVLKQIGKTVFLIYSLKGTEKGRIKLNGATLTMRSGTEWEIETKGRTYFMRCTTAQQRDTWKEAIAKLRIVSINNVAVRATHRKRSTLGQMARGFVSGIWNKFRLRRKTAEDKGPLRNAQSRMNATRVSALDGKTGRKNAS